MCRYTKSLFSICLFLLTCAYFATGNTAQCYFSYAAFNQPGKGPYIETYLSVIGKEIMFQKMTDGNYQGMIEVSMSFTQQQEIKAAKKYILASPSISDTNQLKPNFIDQQRFSLPNGIYTFELSVKDRNTVDPPLTYKEEITIHFPPQNISLSDIELVESYEKTVLENSPLVKSGYKLVPYVSSFFPFSMSKLSFYAETYNTSLLGTDEKYLATYYIESYETNARLTEYYGYTKQTAGLANVLLASINIKNLPSGNYNLVVDIKDKNNASIALKKLFFQRQNSLIQYNLDDLSAINTQNSFVLKYNDKDSLREFIRSLKPISTEQEKQFADYQLMNARIDFMQQYFLNFWKNRNAFKPEEAWLSYQAEVKKANAVFSISMLKGYDTDRGRVYLQYGPPDSRTEVPNEPSAHPYEVWQYYKLKDQTNRRFIFYNPDLVSNNYSLLHSDARGERYDSRWDMKLHNRNNSSINYDIQKAPEHFGGNSDDYYLNPR